MPPPLWHPHVVITTYYQLKKEMETNTVQSHCAPSLSGEIFSPCGPGQGGRTPYPPKKKSGGGLPPTHTLSQIRFPTHFWE
jgi:hypothetical protein